MPYNNGGYGGMGGFVPYGYLSAQVRQSQDNPEEAAQFQKRITLQTIANMLMQQGQQPLQGQMVGRFYVPPSPVQGLSNMTNTILGAFLAGKGSQDYVDEAKVQADESRAAQKKVADAMLPPTREVPEVPPQPLQGPGAPMRVPMSQTYPATQFDSPYLPEELRPTASRIVEGPQPMTPAIPARTETMEDTPEAQYDRIRNAMIQMDPRVQNQVMPYLEMQAKQIELKQAREAKQEELAQKQEFQAQQNDLARQNLLERAEQTGSTNILLATLAGANKEQLQKMQQDLDRQKMAETKQLTIAQDPNSPTGWSHFDAATGKVVVSGAAPPSGGASGAAGGIKPPAGYRFKGDGDLEAIPGGPADMKMQGALNQDTMSLQSSTAELDRLAQSANMLKNHPGLKGITGIRGAIPNIPGSDAANAEAQLATLKSQIGFGVLQAMRNASKTGGALGSVSDAEGKRLEANLAALDKAQSLDQMKQSLDAILKFTDEAKGRLQDAFNMRHDSSSSSKPKISQQPYSEEKERQYQEFLKRKKNLK